VELRLTSDQELFAESTRKFMEDKCSVTDLRALRDDPDGFVPDVWRQGAELGWTSLLVSEEDGGGSFSGAPVKDAALLAYEFGRQAAAGPFLPANLVGAALSRWGTDEQKAEVLSGLLDGSVVASWAWAEPRPHDRLGEVALTATPADGGYRLSGAKSPVEAGGQSSHLLVTARTPGGLTNFLVPRDSSGVSVTPMKGLDLTRRWARIDFDGVTVPASAVVGEVDGAEPNVEELLQLALVLQSAEVTGAMSRCLEITVEWAFNRYTFGRPLASYQALKHRFADMRSWLEAGEAIADEAADRVQEQSPRAGEYVSAAKAFLGVYGPELAHDCVQMHGGIGTTYELDLHLYLRRVILGNRLYGTVSEHRQRLTNILEQRETTHA